MSGHNKWRQIKHKKAASDAKKGKLFSLLSRAITVAAKESGPTTKANRHLASAIKEAREANMPSDSIERAVGRASEKEAGGLKKALYEAYGPGGTALIIAAVTDNSNRTTNEIKHALLEHNGKLGVEGAATWAFEKQGDEFIAKFPVTLGEEEARQFEALLEALDKIDDVQDVYSNSL